MDSLGNKVLHSDIKNISQTLNSFICIWERPISYSILTKPRNEIINLLLLLSKQEQLLQHL